MSPPFSAALVHFADEQLHCGDVVATTAQRPSATKSLVIVGSTGSIGCSTLEYVRQRPEEFHIHALVAGVNVSLLARQALEFRPAVVLTNGDRGELARLLSSDTSYKPQIGSSDEETPSLVASSDGDIVVAAIVGMAGLPSVYHALRAGKRVALANKEAIVCGAQVLKNLPGKIIPVDSEHSASFELLAPKNVRSAFDRLTITASGGPFRGMKRSELEGVTAEQACRHPVWSMGRKISVDSATLFNKALELIEAHYLFGIPARSLSAIVHPESIIHALVSLSDGGVIAGLALPDMSLPIARALHWPAYPPSRVLNVLDLASIGALHFEDVDNETFPAPKLALQATQQGGNAAAVLNTANEVAVNKFLSGSIRFPEISTFVQRVLEQEPPSTSSSLEELLDFTAELRQRIEARNI